MRGEVTIQNNTNHTPLDLVIHKNKPIATEIIKCILNKINKETITGVGGKIQRQLSASDPMPSAHEFQHTPSAPEYSANSPPHSIHPNIPFTNLPPYNPSYQDPHNKNQQPPPTQMPYHDQTCMDTIISNLIILQTYINKPVQLNDTVVIV